LDILFADKKLEKTCNDHRLLQKVYGEKRAKKLHQRLDELRAADVLADISHLPPQRMHQLVGDRARQFSVDLDNQYRLIFYVANNPLPIKDDGGLDLLKVTAILIRGVEDTHE
jgi:plasmid maintenance system killer protein